MAHCYSMRFFHINKVCFHTCSFYCLNFVRFKQLEVKRLSVPLYMYAIPCTVKFVLQILHSGQVSIAGNCFWTLKISKHLIKIVKKKVREGWEKSTHIFCWGEEREENLLHCLKVTLSVKVDFGLVLTVAAPVPIFMSPLCVMSFSTPVLHHWLLPGRETQSMMMSHNAFTRQDCKGREG